MLENIESIQKKTITIPLQTTNLKNEFEILVIKNKKHYYSNNVTT